MLVGHTVGVLSVASKWCGAQWGLASHGNALEGHESVTNVFWC